MSQYMVCPMEGFVCAVYGLEGTFSSLLWLFSCPGSFPCHISSAQVSTQGVKGMCRRLGPAAVSAAYVHDLRAAQGPSRLPHPPRTPCKIPGYAVSLFPARSIGPSLVPKGAQPPALPASSPLALAASSEAFRGW